MGAPGTRENPEKRESENSRKKPTLEREKEQARNRRTQRRARGTPNREGEGEEVPRGGGMRAAMFCPHATVQRRAGLAPLPAELYRQAAGRENVVGAEACDERANRTNLEAASGTAQAQPGLSDAHGHRCPDRQATA